MGDVGSKRLIKVTCSCSSSDSVNVDLGKAGGVVVDDDLDSWNIQTSVKEREGYQSVL